jgi:hypothetical protein
MAKNTPNFSVDYGLGNSEGFHTRLIYSCTPHILTNLAGSDFTDSTKNAFTYLGATCENVNGSYKIPAFSWRTGKNLRIRGFLTCTSGATGETLNMTVGLESRGGIVATLGSQNSGSADHTFTSGATGAQGPLPTFFEIEISCGGASGTSAGSYAFMANGFYEYAYYPNSDNVNNENYYIPIWDSGGPNFLISDYYDQESKIFFNMNDSTISELYLHSIIIEELG